MKNILTTEIPTQFTLEDINEALYHITGGISIELHDKHKHNFLCVVKETEPPIKSPDPDEDMILSREFRLTYEGELSAQDVFTLGVLVGEAFKPF